MIDEPLGGGCICAGQSAVAVYRDGQDQHSEAVAQCGKDRRGDSILACPEHDPEYDETESDRKADGFDVGGGGFREYFGDR